MNKDSDSILFLSNSDVETLESSIDWYRITVEALKEYGLGLARNVPRIWIPTSNGGLFRALAAFSDQNNAVGIKQGLWSPREVEGAEKIVERRTELVVLMSAEDGLISGFINSARMNEIRTAALSAVAIDYLSNKDASTFTVLGSGPFSRALLEKAIEVRTPERIYVYSKHYSNARKIVDFASSELDIVATPIENMKDATCKSEIILEATYPREPFIGKSDVKKGTHISSVGSTFNGRRVFEDSFYESVDLIVPDFKGQALSDNAGDLVRPIEMGTHKLDSMPELSDIILKEHPGRSREDEITMFKSLGMGLLDISFAKAFYDAAISKGLGQKLYP